MRFKSSVSEEGRYSYLVDRSQTVLVTADETLARAARSEGLKTWSLPWGARAVMRSNKSVNTDALKRAGCLNR